MLQKKVKNAVSIATAFALVCAGAVSPWGTNEAQAAKKAKLKTISITVKVGKTKKIKIAKKNKKAKYTFASSKK